MKSKLMLSAAALALATAPVLAQEVTPPPAQPPAERMETPAPPAATPAPGAAAVETGAGTFATAQSADEWRSSRLVGMTVYNAANESVGDINDLIIGADGQVKHAVIGVGGFLGIGEKLVAVSFDDLTFNREQDGSARVTINSTKDALQNAPDYTYHTTGTGIGTSD